MGTKFLFAPEKQRMKHLKGNVCIFKITFSLKHSRWTLLRREEGPSNKGTHTHTCTDMHAGTEHMTGPWAVKYAAAPKNAGRIWAEWLCRNWSDLPCLFWHSYMFCAHVSASLGILPRYLLDAFQFWKLLREGTWKKKKKKEKGSPENSRWAICVVKETRLYQELLSGTHRAGD